MNLLFMSLRTFQSPEYLSGHLRRFQEMMRDRTPESYDRFWGPVWDDFRTLDKPTSEDLVFFLAGEMKLGFPHLRELRRNAIDLAFSMAFVLVSHWRASTSDELEILHDRSSTMSSNRELWDLIVSPEVPESLVGYDRRKVEFPLNVTRTDFVDSRQHIQVQLADVLAGATATWAKSLADPQWSAGYTEALQDAGIEEFAVNHVWPSTNVTPKELGTDGANNRDLIDFMTEIVSRHTPR